MLISLDFDLYLNTLNVDTKQHSIHSGYFFAKDSLCLFCKIKVNVLLGYSFSQPFWVSEMACCHLVVACPRQDWRASHLQGDFQDKLREVILDLYLIFPHDLKSNMLENKYIISPLD